MGGLSRPVASRCVPAHGAGGWRTGEDVCLVGVAWPVGGWYGYPLGFARRCGLRAWVRGRMHSGSVNENLLEGRAAASWRAGRAAGGAGWPHMGRQHRRQGPFAHGTEVYLRCACVCVRAGTCTRGFHAVCVERGMRGAGRRPRVYWRVGVRGVCPEGGMVRKTLLRRANFSKEKEGL